MSQQTTDSVHQLSNGHWIVARWVERAAQYHAPMTIAERRLTGCHTWYARNVDNLGGGYVYTRRPDALRRARIIYGED